jgi:hypothetical protein
MKCAGNVVHVGKIKNQKMIIVRKFERKVPLGKPTHGWNNNIKIILKFDTRVCTESIQLRIGTSGSVCKPFSSINSKEFVDQVNDS